MKQIYHSDQAPPAIGPYSQACGFGDIIFCSGQIALGADGESYLDQPVEDQCERALLNMKAVLEASGSDLSSVLKVGIFLLDMEDFTAVNAVYERFFPSHPPARACVAVSGLPRGAKIELECIAIKSQSRKNHL